MSSMTRGPLPARVYWRRRLAVLGVALLLVVGLARLLGGGSDGSSGDGSSGDGQASLADAPASSGSAGATGAPSASTPPPPPSTPAAPTSTPPATPDGPCADSDLAVTPEVTEAIGGPDHGVAIQLHVRSISAEACTWKVSASSLTLRITSGSDDIWSSRECPKTIPSQQLTVRRSETTTVGVTWNSRRSDEDCSRLTEWAAPGWYHVSAAALGGEPSDVQFELLAPPPVVITRTVEPEPEKGGRKNTPSGDGSGSGSGSGQPGGQPSGAVEPDSTSQDE